MPGMTVERCDKLFNEIKPKVIEFIKKFKKSSLFSSANPFQGTIYPKIKQEEFLREITETLGYSYESGLLNETKRHPQTDVIAIGDVRICTRYSQNDPLIGILSGIHEAGHGINLQGVPKDYYGMPVFNSPGLDMDEAQSRFFENHIGRSKPFWQYYFPTFKEKFSPASDNISLDDLYRYANRINLGPIRLEADEVSYVLHIIIRYEIERDLFGNIINTENLPNIWMQKHEDYLGVQVPDDRSGILQDIHWAAGLFGYFPSYVLGSLNAAQLDAAMRRDYPDLDQHLASGDLNIMASWMKDHVYKYGSIYEVPELMKLASGKDTDFTDFLIYLGNKYR
jgi:carboxypeptidase Taq